MNKIYTFIEKHATIKNSILGLILIVMFNTFFLPFIPSLLFNYTLEIGDVLDLKIRYNAVTVYNLFEKLGATGRNSYKLSTLFVDTPYLIIYSITYTFILFALLKVNHKLKYKTLIAIPILIGLFDFLENCSITFLLHSFPIKHNQLVQYSSMFTSMKWTFALLTLVLVLGNVLYYSYSKIKK